MISSFLLTTSLFLDQASAHGKLTIPKTRQPDVWQTTASERNPIGFGGTSFKSFVCRDEKNRVDIVPPVYTAGQDISMTWDITALHVGDAAVYISYDDEIPWENIEEMEFFKIANIPNTKDYDETDYKISLPEWLPAGNAVLRWEWYALHNNPSVELYVQCSDVVITAKPGSEIALNTIPKYRVVEELADGTFEPKSVYGYNVGGDKYRNAYAPYDGNQFMSGPECACEYSSNKCYRTERGTAGNVNMGASGDCGGLVATSTTTNAPPTTTTDAAPPSTDGPATTTAEATTSSTDTPTTASELPTTPSYPYPGEQCVDESRYEDSQCGGEDYNGNKCCPTGTVCMMLNLDWSGCKRECPEGWLCECDPSESECCWRQSGAQCNGLTYEGPEKARGCCAPGHTCQGDEWWSGCFAA